MSAPVDLSIALERALPIRLALALDESMPSGIHTTAQLVGALEIAARDQPGLDISRGGGRMVGLEDDERTMLRAWARALRDEHGWT